MTEDLEKGKVESGEDVEEVVEEQPKPLRDLISVTVEDVGVLRKRLKVCVPREAIDERLDQSYRELMREALVPGFRKGRAPLALIRKRFGKEVADDVRTTLVSEAYEAAVEKESLDVLGRPDIDFEKIELPEEGDLEFTCEVEIRPEFDLPELEGIEIRRPKVAVTDADVDAEIQRLRALRGRFETVEDGVKPDDLVVADITVSVDGEEVRRVESASIFARPRPIEGIMLENLPDVLSGAKPGDKRTAEETVPDDYEPEQYRGKPATVEITVREVKRFVMPELDQEFLSSLGFDSEDELRNYVRGRLESTLDRRIRQDMRRQVYQYLLENTNLDLPERLSERQTNRVMIRRILQMRSEGVPDAEIEKRLDELKSTAREQALNDLKLFFIMEKVAEKLGVEVSEEELNGRIAMIAQAYGRRFDRVRDDMIRDGSFEGLYYEIRDEKCIDQILEKAKIVEEVPEQPAEQKPAEEESDAT